MTDNIYKPHLHTPPHWFVPNAIYIVTGATFYKNPLLDIDSKRVNFCETLMERANILGWSLEAWVVMSNHYHFVARSPADALSLKLLVQGLHSINAKFVNRIDGTPGRKIWYNYWDSCIRTEQSYRARLNYVSLNPVKHGLVKSPGEYSFSSYQWFLDNANPDFRKLVLSESADGEQIEDDF